MRSDFLNYIVLELVFFFFFHVFRREGENDCFMAFGWTPEGQEREGDQRPLGEELLRERETRQGGRVEM